MRATFRAGGTRLRVMLVGAAAVATLVGCASAVQVSRESQVADGMMISASSSAASSADSTPTVEVRQYPYSPTLAIVGYSADDTGLGLRTWVRREGTKAPEHRLYISTFYTPAFRTFKRAESVTGPLKMLGVMADPQSCSSGGEVCTPYTTYGVRIPDELLRSGRDSIPVTLYGRDGGELAITVRKQLIHAYLVVVDSVSASLRRK